MGRMNALEPVLLLLLRFFRAGMSRFHRSDHLAIPGSLRASCLCLYGVNRRFGRPAIGSADQLAGWLHCWPTGRLVVYVLCVYVIHQCQSTIFVTSICISYICSKGDAPPSSHTHTDTERERERERRVCQQKIHQSLRLFPTYTYTWTAALLAPTHHKSQRGAVICLVQGRPRHDMMQAVCNHQKIPRPTAQDSTAPHTPTSLSAQ
mmetsp:Transcript_38326/g.96006  ORF Transcript_38326/g.96006 Transcript_38326/m.96006 type:complete len:206 (-) Transcript_38326:2484-3101(-)